MRTGIPVYRGNSAPLSVRKINPEFVPCSQHLVHRFDSSRQKHYDESVIHRNWNVLPRIRKPLAGISRDSRAYKQPGYGIGNRNFLQFVSFGYFRNTCICTLQIALCLLVLSGRRRMAPQNKSRRNRSQSQ